MSAEKAATFEGWCVLELMGHRRLGGYVSEAVISGAGLIRIDVPGLRPGETVATQFYSPSALYCMTPTTEEIARAVAAKAQPEQVQRWELAPAQDVNARNTLREDQCDHGLHVDDYCKDCDMESRQLADDAGL